MGIQLGVEKAWVDGGEHINVIDSTHGYIHRGHTYMAGHYAASVANGATTILLLSTGASYDAHMTLEVVSDGSFTVAIHEGVTTSNDGTGLTEFCKVRGIVGGDAAANVSAFHTPTISVAGTQLGPTWPYPGGTGPTSTGTSSMSRDEWVLKPSTKYTVTLTNTSGTNKYHGVRATWYDHDPITAKDQVQG